MDLNLVDLLLGLVLLLSLWSGWRRGFVLSTLQLVSLVAGVLIAFWGYRWVAGWIGGVTSALGVWLLPASFLLTLLVAQLVIGLFTGALVRSAGERVHRHGVNRLLGLVPGGVNGIIHASILALLLQTLPLSARVSEQTRDSVLAQSLSQPAEWLEAQLSPIFDPAIRRSLQTLTVQPESNASITLPFKVQDARPRPELEARMLELVNAERAREGLRPLQADPDIVPVARAHSRDMFGRGYFSHQTLGGGSLGDRLRKGNVRYLLAGENIALAPTLQRAHQGLMDSPGHRANILRPQFGRVGIGVLDGGVHGLMITQNFRN